MYKKHLRVMMLGALVVSSVAWAAPDFTAQMTQVANFQFSGNPFAFMDPATADLNENGVLDATEFKLLEAIMDGSLSFSADVNTAYNANVAAMTTHLSGTAATILGATTDAFKSVLAGYVTLGSEREYNVLDTVLTGVNANFGVAPTHSPGAFNQTQGQFCGPCGDADGDGVKNLHEALAAADAAAFVSAALNNGVTTAGADTLGGCVFKFDAEPGGANTRHWFYNPDNGNVYFVGTDYQGNMLPTQVADFATRLSVNGLLIENAYPVVINDASENAFIATFRTEGSYWTGANDAAVEGVWRWSDGTQFWQGAAAGSAVGGAYTNWNGGEPNNSGDGAGEDFMEFNMASGGWNDDDPGLQAVIIEIEGDFTDSNSDGIPDQWLDNNNDGFPDGLSVGTVSISVAGGVPVVKAGFTLGLSATSEPGDLYTWSSSNESVATVTPTGSSVQVTGVSPGTVTISVEVTGPVKGLGALGSVVITVVAPEWYDICDEISIFNDQLNLLASFGLDEEDMELGVGDGVPDAWQAYLLAYALCKGGSGVPASATAAYNANLAALNPAIASAASGYSPFVANIVGQLDEIEALAVKFATNPCDGAFAGIDVPSISAALYDVVDAGGDLSQLMALPVLLGPNVVGSGLAALATTSTEMGLTLNAALADVTDIQDNFDLILTVIGGIAANLGACPDNVAADAAAIYGALTSLGTTVPAVTWPTWTAAQDPAKTATEPLAGAGDYNQDGLTNAQVAAIVIAQGGDENDFVIAATGDFGPFWPGNPNLPLGVAVLGGLVGAFAAAGAVSIRRRRQ